MNPSTFVYSILAIGILLTTTYAESITKILDSYPDFSDLNKFLVSTGIDREIDRESAVTLLALDNDEMEQLSRLKAPEQIANIIRAHVVLDYYDDIKLRHLRFGQVQEMATLYQSGGSVRDKQGLLKVTRKEYGVFFQSSGRKSSPGDAKFVDRIYVRKYSTSIIKINHPIYIDGLTDELEPVPPPTYPMGAKALVAEAPKKHVAEAPLERIPRRSPAPSPRYAKSPANGAGDGETTYADISPGNDVDGEEDELADDKSKKKKKKSSAGKVTFGLATLIMAAICIAATL